MTVPVQIYDSISGAQEGAPAYGAAAELRLTKTNAAALTPGRFVCRDAHDRKVKIPTTAAEALACVGIAELSDTQILSSSTAGDYPINTRLSIVRKGVIWMLATTAAVQGEDVYVYYAGAVAKGKVGGTSVPGENIKLPGAKFWTTQATPGALVAVEVDLPSGSANNAPSVQNVVAVVTYDGSGVPTLATLTGVVVADTATGKFTLTAAGATSVLPAGMPIVERATDTTTGGLGILVEVGALAATAVTYSVIIQQSDDEDFDVADPPTATIFYCPLQITY